ncbi:unnamed protein product [Candidula unifasciata]|uniref:Galactosylgalactosylxylosylprotein 3-beta-glucuronosyltransferase n=1 Tax=Candidula unifasciata TaxID=100452 RepID=A0A8S3ZSL4_9EUPU|nr:unnamed protein product [Candidula unifasciata]
MSLMRYLTPSKFLVVCAAVLMVILMILIIDLTFSCNSEELASTKRLLQKYSDQLQTLKTEHVLMAHKLRETELQLATGGTNRLSNWVSGLPVIYLITPTYTRLEQKAELTRLSHTLMLVKNIHWIVIEDSESQTDLVARFLKQTGLNYTHLNVPTPAEFKLNMDDPNWLKPRGVLQRNAGLEWLRRNTSPRRQPGVVYFADDDNTYSLKLFDEMRFTKKVSVWPVGLVGYLRYEKPIVQNGKVIAWFTYWKPNRPFPMDMAGFAINLQLLHDHPEAAFTNSVQRGYQESTLLSGLKISQDDLEPKANMCSEVLVWHTRTEKSKTRNEDNMIRKYGRGSDPRVEV